MTGRRYPARPLLGVGAILLSPDLAQVLLIQRGVAPARGLWSFPGGLVEAGERARQACRREVREETGLEVELQDLALVAERLIHDEAGTLEYHYVILDFWGLIEVQPPRAGSDVVAAEWVAVAALAGRPSTRGLDQAVARVRRLAQGQPAGGPILEE